MKTTWIAAGLLAITFATHPSHAQVPARTCYDFVESIGVCTHWDYNETKYVQAFDIVKGKLGALGVRYIRDKSPIVNTESRNRSLAVYNELGIKTLTVFAENYYTPAQIDAKLNDLVGKTNMVMAFEGPNEADAGKKGKNDPCCWTNDLRANQLYIFNAVNNHPDGGISSKQVIAPSPTFPSGIAWMGPMTDRADRYNIHSYHGGNRPEDPASNFAKYLAEVPAVNTADGSASQKIWATEAGNHNQETGPKGNGISEDGEAKYINRMFLYYFKKGINRTFNYELVDLKAEDPNDNQDNFGLLRYDLTEKPTYKALKNLISILKDNADFTPGPLTYSVSRTDGIERVLLQKSTGKFYLCLWQTASVYDPAANTNITNDPVQVTITANIASANVYVPKNGTSVTNTFGPAGAITVQVPDHPVIIEITPANGSARTASAGEISKAENGETLVYPNPGSDGIFYLTPVASGIRITVTDLKGRVVIAETDWKSETLDLSGEPDGVYLLRTSTGKAVKLIKK